MTGAWDLDCRDGASEEPSHREGFASLLPVALTRKAPGLQPVAVTGQRSRQWSEARGPGV